MRIWVTGLGVVSALARGAEATMDRLIAGDRAQHPLELLELPVAVGATPPQGLRPFVTAEVRGLRVDEVAPPGEVSTWSRTDAMSVIAAREALGQASIRPGA